MCVRWSLEVGGRLRRPRVTRSGARCLHVFVLALHDILLCIERRKSAKQEFVQEVWLFTWSLICRSIILLIHCAIVLLQNTISRVETANGRANFWYSQHRFSSSLSDEFPPRPYFGWDPAFRILLQATLGYLLLETLNKKLRAAGIVQ